MVAAGSITVAVRVRPPTSWEAGRLPEQVFDNTIRGDGALSTPGKATAGAGRFREVVQVVDDRILTFDPAEHDRAKAFMERGFMPPGTKRYKDRRFMFDKVFNHETQQRDVFEATSRPLLSNLLDGYNATVFAYGATGCGKTHTISGTDTDPGIIYLTMADLFQRIEDRRDEWNVDVMVTFLEIYNEEIRDLLSEPTDHVPRGGLSIREDKTVKVVGLKELKPNTAEEVKQIVLQGNSRRTQSPTHANETSSRSHAVLQVHVTQSPRTAALSEQRTTATLSIIDLAGSERAAATSNMGQRMVEGANINKSLLALGNCINALCESGGAVRHVPYRNSKLTRLLKFSLGGNCKTVMIVCVAPTSHHFDDTHNTLIYAERATKIKTKVVTRNVVNVDRHVGQYVEAINRLNSEIAELKAKLAGKNNSESELTRRRRAEANADVERAKKDLQAKVDQTKTCILDGASCAAKMSVAKLKLDAIRSRLGQIDAMGPLSSLPSDVLAERKILQSMAGPEDQALKPDSTLSARLQRASNSRSMFDATLRAVSERRTERMDEVSIDNVKLDARCRKAELEAQKAQEEINVMRDTIQDMAQVMVSLSGMLGRCTVMIGEAATVLEGGSESEADSRASTIADLLKGVQAKNDQTFIQLIGQTTKGYTNAHPTLESMKTYTPVAHTTSAPSSRDRRTSKYGALTSNSSPLRVKSPRKALRPSLAAVPYRRVPEKERVVSKAKNVQWRDQVGQGDLDDGGPRQNLLSPVEDSTSSTSSTGSGNTPQRGSVGGSESEWEDEKTDDSVSMKYLSSSLPPSTRDSTGTYGLGKRPRASRLDPSFLKSKKSFTLGSLAEDDEISVTSPHRHVSQPLSDRLNHHTMVAEDSEDSNSTRKSSDSRQRAARGAPSSGKTRRRSIVGPLRGEKGRRRSSLIPKLSPQNIEPRFLASPSKRGKRLSITRSSSSFKFKTGPSLNAANLSVMDTSIGDTSFTKSSSSRPTWR